MDWSAGQSWMMADRSMWLGRLSMSTTSTGVLSVQLNSVAQPEPHQLVETKDHVAWIAFKKKHKLKHVIIYREKKNYTHFYPHVKQC
jgi:hypothetical protein